MSTSPDFHAANPHIARPPTPRERVEEMRKEAKVRYSEAEKGADAALAAGRDRLALSCGDRMMQFQDRIWQCGLADILLDAIEAR
jgi:hypothetical protein